MTIAITNFWNFVIITVLKKASSDLERGNERQYFHHYFEAAYSQERWYAFSLIGKIKKDELSDVKTFGESAWIFYLNGD